MLIRNLMVIISLFVLTTVSSVYTLKGQDLLSVEYKNSYSLQDVQALIVIFGINVSPQYGFDTYKITYSTTGSDGLPDIASGLIMLPDIIDKPLPVVCYQHGTTSGRSDVPSELEGGYLLGALFASLGMAVTAPDYLGLGESRGFHPYVHAETEATAAMDMIFALIEYMSENNIERDSEFFITGYSQGGHAAMALHRLIEQSYLADFEVTASLPMSGPYDISGVIRDIIYSEEEYYYPSFLVYGALGARAINPDLFNDVSEFFADPFLPAIRNFEASGEGLSILNLELLTILENDFGGSVPSFMFRDSILTVLSAEPDHPFNQYLEDNDVYEWVPLAPVRMLYCLGDDQVLARNTIIADSVMNALGALNVESFEVSGGVMRDHTACIVPALNNGIPWLLGFLDTSPVVEIGGESVDLQIYPNPVSDDVTIELTGQDILFISISDMSGRKIYSHMPNQQSAVINVSSYLPGLYWIQIMTAKGMITQKVIVQP